MTPKFVNFGISKSADDLTEIIGLKKEMSGRSTMYGLEAERFVSVMVDGVGFGDRTVITALGITINGQKKLLGLREGASGIGKSLAA